MTNNTRSRRPQLFLVLLPVLECLLVDVALESLGLELRLPSLSYAAFMALAGRRPNPFACGGARNIGFSPSYPSRRAPAQAPPELRPQWHLTKAEEGCGRLRKAEEE